MSSIRPTEGRMDESSGSSNSLPPFLSKIYEMVDDPSMDFVVSWSSTGRSFIVWNQLEFSRDLLPKYFKHNNFSSFIRQLNTYGFRKIDPEQWEFASDDFLRGQPHLLKNIHRRKPVHSHSLQNLQSQVNAAPLSEVERQSLKDKVRKLKQERQLLSSELQKRNQEKKEYELQMRDFKERLQGLQCRQKSLLSLVASTLQNAGPALNLGPQLDVQERKRRLRFGYLFDEFVAGSNHLKTCRCWDSTEENNNDSCESSCYMEKLERLESSLTAWGDIVHQYHVQDNLIPENVSIGYVDSPSISCVQLDVDVPPKSPGIDMNSELPASPSTADTLKEKTDKTNASVRTGVNDVFWEQFLTENPGSSQEVHSERDVFDGRKSDAGPGDHFDLWWNLGNVNNPAGKTGHLTRT